MTTPEKPTLHVFTDGEEWWLAPTLEDALAQQRKECGIPEADQDPKDWRQLGDTDPLTIIEDPYDTGEKTTTKACAEWAAEASGPGLLCASDW